MKPSRHSGQIVLLAGFVLLAGCKSYEDDVFSVYLNDQAGVLSEETHAWLQNYSYPPGFAFGVQTVDSVSELSIGVKADDIFEATIDQHPQSKAFSQRGVLVVVSKQPSLIQIRVGSELYSKARWGGLTAGSQYIQKQQIAFQGDLNSATQETVEWLATHINDATDFPWYKEWVLQGIVQTLHFELDQLNLPSESFYGEYLLAPITELRIAELKLFGSWWISFVLIGILFYIVKFLLEILLKPLSKLSHPAIGNTVRIILSLGIGIMFALPSAGSAVLLSGSRMEDQIALKAAGVPGIEQFQFQPDLFNESTVIWVAILIAIVRILKGFAGRSGILQYVFLPKDVQKGRYLEMKDHNPVGAFLLMALGTRAGKTIELSEEDFEDEPYTSAYFLPAVDDITIGIKWGILAWLFLPLAFSLSVMYFWIVPTVVGIFTTLFVLLVTRKKIAYALKGT